MYGSELKGGAVAEEIPTKVAGEAYALGGRTFPTWNRCRAMAARRSLETGKRWWISDTGSPFDLVGRKTLSPEMRDTIEKAKPPEEMDTAGGPCVADQVAHVQIEVLEEHIDPYVLDDSPDVLTVGRRCRKHGYGFHWEPFGDAPYYVSPDGKVIWHECLDGVPYLPDDWNAENAPPLVGGLRSQTEIGSCFEA